MAAAEVNRLEIEKADDRDAVVQILARNGYTVRQVKEKNTRYTYYVEFWKGGRER